MTAQATAAQSDQPHTHRVAGALTASRVPELLRESKQWFASGQDLVLDLSAVTQADSAGVALLLDWTRQARRQQVRLHLNNIPEQMQAIIDFCALGDILGLSSNST